MIKQFPLRLDEEMLDELRTWADEEDRSTHAQIVSILRKALEHHRAQVAADRRHMARIMAE